MSNALAIAAVTATLRNLLQQGIQLEPDLVDTTVTTTVPDRARTNSDTANQVNLFLYQAMPNAAWRNLDVPSRVRPGETGFPPLALNLYYLLTVYGRDNDQSQPFSHELLGRAMSILHDHPVLGQDEIEAALPGNDLATQIERIRFTLQPLSVEEIYRLWTGFQTSYRPSVSYEATVVLIDSTRAMSAPLPVLTRGRPKWFAGKPDGGVLAVASIVPPAITTVIPSGAAIFGQRLTLQGTRLSGDAVTVSIVSPTMSAPVVVQAETGRTDRSVRFVVPAGSAQFPAGLYSLGISVTHSDLTYSSNALPLSLGPTITSGLPATITASAGTATLTLGCDPPVQANQRASLLLGNQEILATASAPPASSLSFTLTNTPAGKYFTRLRVDGADSALVADQTATPPTFDPSTILTVQ
jgi:hypothetical protein